MKTFQYTIFCSVKNVQRLMKTLQCKSADVLGSIFGINIIDHGGRNGKYAYRIRAFRRDALNMAKALNGVIL